jgi:8-oxo-dGTP pyrophosphatase MutT (NUDIX family)
VRDIAAAVVVWRRARSGLEFLIVHRSHEGPDYVGDWAWGPPGGAIGVDENAAVAAERELFEETGLALECHPTPCEIEQGFVFHAEAPPDAGVVLSAEHDAFEWLPLEEARARCLPAVVADELSCVAAVLAHELDQEPDEHEVAHEHEERR